MDLTLLAPRASSAAASELTAGAAVDAEVLLVHAPWAIVRIADQARLSSRFLLSSLLVIYSFSLSLPVQIGISGSSI